MDNSFYALVKHTPPSTQHSAAAAAAAAIQVMTDLLCAFRCYLN